VVALAIVVAIRFALPGLIVEPLVDATASFGRTVQGDLSRHPGMDIRHEVRRALASIWQMWGILITIVKVVNVRIESIDTGARDIDTGNAGLSRRVVPQEFAPRIKQLAGIAR
jgi:methyl-accepting chemotaxis protein I, serine sensor receptor